MSRNLDQIWKIQEKINILFKWNFFLNYREEAEFLISGDHDHYISSAETIVLQNEAVAYEEAIEEPRPKKRK